MKKILSILAVLSLSFSLVGCNKEVKEDETKTVEKKEQNEFTKQAQSKMYNAVRVAETKVNDVFAHDVAEDETTPIILASLTDETTTEQFLSKYYSLEMATEIFTYYNTGKLTEKNQIIVKADPFFEHSLLETKFEDMKFEGDVKKATMKTKDNVTYTIELKDGKYIVTSIQK